jgi:uncharacterized phage protein (TIGR01671 family)
MYEVDDIMSIDFGKSEISVKTLFFERTNYYKFDDLVLMQSTGLRDKNGKEIFEGDIVDYKGKKAVVKWHGSYASFVYMFVDESRDRNQEWDPLYLSYFHFEVVGNKFETPALLEVSS